MGHSSGPGREVARLGQGVPNLADHGDVRAEHRARTSATTNVRTTTTHGDNDLRLEY